MTSKPPSTKIAGAKLKVFLILAFENPLKSANSVADFVCFSSGRPNPPDVDLAFFKNSGKSLSLISTDLIVILFSNGANYYPTREELRKLLTWKTVLN